MLKFFREYNAYILAVGMALLMVAFLIGPALEQAGGRGSSNPTVGRLDGQRVRNADISLASAQLRLLSFVDQTTFNAIEAGNLSMGQGMLPLFEARMLLNRPDLERDGTAFALMKLEMQQMSIGTSQDEIASFLSRVGLGFDGLQQIAARLQMRTEVATEALGAILAVPEYFFAVTGRRGPEDLSLLSPEAVKRAAFDMEPTTAIRAARIPLDAYIDQASASVDDEQVRALFDEFKNFLPGEGEPYGFGYSRPKGVKIEWIQIPWNQLLSRVRDPANDPRVSINLIIDTFNAGSLERFSDELRGDPPDREANPEEWRRQLEMVEQSIRSHLEVVAARTLSDQIAKFITDEARRAEGLLPMGERGELAGLRLIDTSFEPIPLSQIAEAVQERFGILPRVVRLDGEWLSPEQWKQLDGIGQSAVRLDSERGASFHDYLMSLREFIGTNPARPEAIRNESLWIGLLTLRLQQSLISQPLRDVQDNQYLFRVIESRPQTVPDFDEVARQVRADAVMLEAHRLAKADIDRLLATAQGTGLSGLAAEVGSSVFTTGRFPRRQVVPEFEIEWRRSGSFGDNPPPYQPTPTRPTFSVAAPPIDPRINADEAFVDAVIDRAESIGLRGGLGMVPRSERKLVLPIDANLSLWAVEIIEFRPLTELELDMSIAALFNPQSTALRDTIIMVNSIDGLENMFTTNAIATRIGFEWVDRNPDEDDEMVWDD